MPRGPLASAGRTSMRPRSNMKLNPEDLAKITDFTLSHYNEHAEDFWEGTRDAALFHVPTQELPRVLLELYASLKPGGVLFSSNPRGHNEDELDRMCKSVFDSLPALEDAIVIGALIHEP